MAIVNDGASPLSIRRLLRAPDQARLGCYDVAKGVRLQVLEERFAKKHSHIRGSLPDNEPIETEFEGGPIIAFHCEDSFVDVRFGVSIVNQQVLREPIISSRALGDYRMPSRTEFAEARVLAPGMVVQPVAAPRMANYCRFWTDSLAKLYVYERSIELRSSVKASAKDAVVPKL